MKLAKYLILSLAAILASESIAGTFYYSRGMKGTTVTRLYTDKNNWSKTYNGSDGWNIDPANAIPGADDSLNFNYKSGYDGETWRTARPALSIYNTTYLGRFNINNTNELPLLFVGPPEVELVLNSTSASGGDIIYKTRNTGYFEFAVNIRVKSTGMSSVNVKNDSDGDLIINGKNFIIEPYKVGTISVNAYVTFNTIQRSKPDQWTDYARGNILINSAIQSEGNVEFRADTVSSATNAVGSIWLKGTESNIIPYAHVKYGVILYLDKENGAQAVSSPSGKNCTFYLGWRSKIVLMADNQIADNAMIQFKTPILSSSSPSDLTAVLDLNGHSERIGKIEYWNDNTSQKQGLLSVIDFGNGGEQAFTFDSFSIPTDPRLASRVYFYRTFIEFRSYRQGEDHVYCKTQLSTKTYNYDDPNDRVAKPHTNLLRFPEFGVFNVDYTIKETQVTVNGESLWEYSPTPKN